MRFPIAMIAACLLWTFAPRGSGAEAPAVDLNAIAAAGVKTSKSLEDSPAAWTAETTLSNGAVVRVSVLSSPGKRATEIAVIAGGQTTVVERVIARDGLWYVQDGHGQSKYRPHEAPVDSPVYSIARDRAEPLFVTSAARLNGLKLETVEANIATFRRPLEKLQAQQLQSAIDQIDALPAQTGKPNSPEIQAQEQTFKALIANGTEIRINISTGQIVDFGTQAFRTRVTAFNFATQIDDGKFSVGNQDWQDFSDDPTNGNLDDLILIAHDPVAQANDNAEHELDGRLMNVKTGRFRRIPFPQSLCIPGCFLKGRRSVIVSGLDADSGALRPYRIDLKTGQCDLLGGQLLLSGSTMGPDLSPDGKTLAVMHTDPRLGLLAAQIYLIDVQTGVAKPLGDPLDTAFPQWTADGQHLMVLTRKYTNLNSRSIDAVALMDMGGKVTELCKGESPILLADRQTILFQDPASSLWQTCDLRVRDTLGGDHLT